jgi:hypothetical protein
MHDESDVSAAGELLGDSATVEDGSLYVDVELDTTTAAGQYADEALAAALESKGREGFGGPSVEIPPDGLRLEPDGPNGVPQTKDGKINGLGFVKQPASKTTAFERQTRERQVALASGETDKARVLQQRDRIMVDAETTREILENNGIDTGDMTDDELMSVYEELVESMQEEGEDGGMDNEDGDKDDDDDDDDDEDMDMQDGVEVLKRKCRNRLTTCGARLTN